MVVRRVGERGFLAGLGRKLAQFLDRVAQKIRLALGALDLGAMLRDRGFGLAAARSTAARNLRGLALQPAEGIEQAAMGRGIDQRAVVMLAVDFDQRAPRLFSTCTPTGWSLTKARVRPSASCTRRRISSSSAAMSLAASSARAG